MRGAALLKTSAMLSALGLSTRGLSGRSIGSGNSADQSDVSLGGALDRFDGKPSVKGRKPSVVLHRESEEPGISNLPMALKELRPENRFVEKRHRVRPELVSIGRAKTPEM